MLETCRVLAPNREVYDRVREVEKRYGELVGPPDAAQCFASSLARQQLVRAYEDRRENRGPRPAPPSLTRTCFVDGKPVKECP